MGYFETLEQRVDTISVSEVHLSYDELRERDLIAKQYSFDGKYDQALEILLTNAKGYESSRDDKERAFALDRAATCVERMITAVKFVNSAFGTAYEIDPGYKIYAQLKEKAGSIFKFVAERTGSFLKDAGYSFLRAAWGYVLADDINKAEELLDEADDMFENVSEDYFPLRQKIIAMIERAKES